MKFRKIYLLCFALVVLFKNANCQQTSSERENTFEFINQRYNLIECKNREMLANFFEKWTKDTPMVRIAHFGDSHIQPDIFTSTVRKKFQQLKGSAGRGMIFPYSIAKTYSQLDYSSSYTGTWKTANSIQLPPKRPIGIAGFVAQTTDRVASFSFRFKTPLDVGEKIVNVFCSKEAKGYSLSIKSNDYIQTARIDTVADKTTPYIQFRLPSLGETIEFTVSKDSIDESMFALFGVSIENNKAGIMYHNLGVGGANYLALPQQTYFEQQFPYIQPDLVVLDWGTNDILYTNKIASNLYSIILSAISRIKKTSPNTLILLTSTQDMNRKGRNISVAKEFSDMMRKIAFENDCLFYDWYRVAGGARSMAKWYANKLAQKDNIHLTMKGYQLKGELFAQALLNTLDFYAVGDNAYYLSPDEQAAIQPIAEIAPAAPIAEQKSKAEKGISKKKEVKSKQKNTKSGTTYYTVRNGDNLSVIANRYRISIAALKKQNNLKSDKIFPGQKLKIK